MPWRVTAGPDEVPPRDYDGVVWRWTLTSDDLGRASVLVRVSGTAAAMQRAALLDRVRFAVATQGESEVARVLGWIEPPTALDMYSKSVEPDLTDGNPGDELEGLRPIDRWFADREMVLIFTSTHRRPPEDAATVGVSVLPAAGGPTLLYDRGSSPLEVARRAQARWGDRPGQVVRPKGIPSGERLGSPTVLQPPRLEPGASGGTVRRTLVWTPLESTWFVHVEDEGGAMLAAGGGDDPDEAILTLYEHLQPPGDGS